MGEKFKGSKSLTVHLEDSEVITHLRALLDLPARGRVTAVQYRELSMLVEILLREALRARYDRERRD